MAVVVVGSLNVDLCVDVARLPAPGETLLADGPVRRTPGGKGLNQAIAAARQGAEVTLVGTVGDDADGRWLLEVLRAEGVDTRHLRTSAGADRPTGTALITVDRRTGENSIVVVPGANAEDTAPPPVRGAGDVVLAQLEVPLATVTGALVAAHAAGATTILNPSPAVRIPTELARAVDVLVVNEHELAITGPGERTTIVTLGERGARVHHEDADRPATEIPPHPAVHAIDTTGAGDAFAGTLAAALLQGLGLDAAVRRATIAGALTTTRRGAAAALPTKAEVDAAYRP